MGKAHNKDQKRGKNNADRQQATNEKTGAAEQQREKATQAGNLKRG